MGFFRTGEFQDLKYVFEGIRTFIFIHFFTAKFYFFSVHNFFILLRMVCFIIIQFNINF
jgi:hypothetical protein